MQTQKRDQKLKARLPIEFMSPFPVEACISRLRGKHNQIVTGSSNLINLWHKDQVWWECVVYPYANGVWRYQLGQALSTGFGFSVGLRTVRVEGYLVRSTDGKSTLVLGEPKESWLFYIGLFTAWAVGLLAVLFNLNSGPVGYFALFLLLPLAVVSMLSWLSLKSQQRALVVVIEHLLGFGRVALLDQSPREESH